jgi:hypothetical protein
MASANEERNARGCDRLCHFNPPAMTRSRARRPAASPDTRDVRSRATRVVPENGERDDELARVRSELKTYTQAALVITIDVPNTSGHAVTELNCEIFRYPPSKSGLDAAVSMVKARHPMKVGRRMTPGPAKERTEDAFARKRRILADNGRDGTQRSDGQKRKETGDRRPVRRQGVSRSANLALEVSLRRLGCLSVIRSKCR